MNSFHDPELDDVLQDDELRHIAGVLKSASMAEPPVDDAFRTGLRRQLMNQAWSMSEGRNSWWRRAFAPPGLAWAGAAAGLLLIASVVVYTTLQQPGGLNQLVVQSPQAGDHSVALQQPILVAFNQPMDRSSTEGAVQITPATTVAYSWTTDSRTLTVQPTGGTLAPNTQYQVTIGPSAKTANGKTLASPKTITFVTQAPPTPAATPTPRPTPSPSIGEHRVADLAGASALSAQWSSDSSSIYFVDGKGALKVAPANGGPAQVIAPDSASSPAVSPTGDRLAYIRAGKIEVLTFASGKTDELAVTPAPTLVDWSKDKVVWAAADGIYEQNGDGSSQRLATLPAGDAVTVVSFSPDAAHAVYTQDRNLFLLNLTTGKSVQLGQTGAATFQGWSPGGSELLYGTADALVVADMQGATQAQLPSGDAGWSSGDAILIGSDTEVDLVRPDGTNLTKIASGTFHSPLWAPNGTAFAFVRGGFVWAATAPALPAEPTALDDATTVVNNFMKARLNGQADAATAFLDTGGKAAYGPGGAALIVTGDPSFTRSYILTSEVTGTQPDTTRFVVRLVLSHDKLEVSAYEETLVLVRDATTNQFLVDQATASPKHDIGKGAQVVNVEVATDTVKVTFDSDLDPATVGDAVVIVDSKGKQLDATASYANRVVTLSGLNLKDGDQYTLVVKTSLRDVQGQHVSAEYDLTLVGPSTKKHPNNKVVTQPTPSPSATPSS